MAEGGYGPAHVLFGALSEYLAERDITTSLVETAMWIEGQVKQAEKKFANA
jgi:hypothetical protein